MKPHFSKISDKTKVRLHLDRRYARKHYNHSLVMYGNLSSDDPFKFPSKIRYDIFFNDFPSRDQVGWMENYLRELKASQEWGVWVFERNEFLPLVVMV